MELRFLGRDQYPLSVASRIIVEEMDQGSASGPCDLRHLTVALSGRRAGRLLLRALVEGAAATDRGLLPPTIVTPGRLPEILLDLEGVIAGPLASKAALIESLRNSPTSVVEELLPPGPKPGIATLLPTAHLLSSTRLALANAGIGFEKAALIASGFDATAARRLHCGEAVDASYRRILDNCGLVDRDDAIASAIVGGVSHPDPVILLSLTEVPPRLRQILQECPDVTAFVHARESDRNRYDDLGQPLAEVWEAIETPPLERRFVSAGTPAGLARALLESISNDPQARSIEEIAIGVADSDLAPWLLETFRRCQITLHDPGGSTFDASAPGALLDALAAATGESNAEILAALVRHPDIHRQLVTQSNEDGPSPTPPDPIVAIDQWRSTRHPKNETDLQAPKVVEKLSTALAPLRESSRPLGQWAQPLGRTICNLVGDTVNPDENWRALIDAIEELAQLPDTLAPTTTAADAISTLCELLARKQIPSHRTGTTMEMLGWLELELDDSPLVVVAGVAEGKIGGSDGSDALLSEGLKKELGLPGSSERGARDAHILDSLLDSPRGAILGLSRTDADGAPLLPSRLLLRGDGAADLLRKFLDSSAPDTDTPLLEEALPRTPADLGFPVPVSDGSGPGKITVTSFGDWLTCPVLFWLRHLLKSKPLHDRDPELDGGSFGGLLHDTLEEFGKDPQQRDLEDAGQICAALESQLQKMVARDLSDRTQAAVSVQIEQARARLRTFADQQAAMRRDGWRIIATEIELDSDLCQLHTEAGALSISGRIDRIDLHEETGRVRILDYKTGDSGKSPEQVHRRGRRGHRQWVNLQLPLYRHFARLIRGDGIPDPFPERVEVGYLLLPRDGNTESLSLAPWSDGEQQQAIDLSLQEGARILRGDFGPAQVIARPFQRAFAGVAIDPVSRISGNDEEAEE